MSQNRASIERERALNAISLMRREHLTLAEAAQRAGATQAAVLRRAKSALRLQDGEYRVTEYDRIRRRMTYLGEDGPRYVTIRDSRQASRLGTYDNDLRHFVRTGDARRLRRWKGEYLQTAEGQLAFITDLDLIEDLGLVGELEFDAYRRNR